VLVCQNRTPKRCPAPSELPPEEVRPFRVFRYSYWWAVSGTAG